MNLTFEELLKQYCIEDTAYIMNMDEFVAHFGEVDPSPVITVLYSTLRNFSDNDPEFKKVLKAYIIKQLKPEFKGH